VPARVPGEGKLEVIEDAPGSYVTLRADANAQATCLPPTREPVVSDAEGPLEAMLRGEVAPATTVAAAEAAPRKRGQRRPEIPVQEKRAAKAVKTALRAPRAKSRKV
jgi:hypothetical protein